MTNLRSLSSFFLTLPFTLSESSCCLPTMSAEKTEAPVNATNQPHKLERKWAFWFDNQKPGTPWGSALRKLYTFDTVEEFWCLYEQVFQPSKIPDGADFHLFKEGVAPKWEDPECANGGKWTVTCTRKTNMDTLWLETMMALIGEQFDEADDICGLVASARPRQDKLSLWTKNASNEAAQMSIGRKWKEILNVDEKLPFSFHDDSKRERSPKGNRYTV